jgi:competence protein ComEA
MRILKFTIKRLKSFFASLNPQSALHTPHSFRYLSLGQQKIVFVFALLLLGILYFKFYHHPALPPSEEVLQEFVVEVVGEVQDPGIHLFRNGPSLKEAIDRAGGLKGNPLFDDAASPDVLETGTLLTASKKSSQEIKINIGWMDPKKLLVFSIPLDLNRVSAEDLCLISGIGESLAQEIVTYRERRKGFRSVEELRNVKGIGEKKYETFRPFLSVRH